MTDREHDIALREAHQITAEDEFLGRGQMSITMSIVGFLETDSIVAGKQGERS